MRLCSVSLSTLVVGLLCAPSASGQPTSVTFGVPPEFSAGISSIVGGFATSPFPALTADLNHDGHGDFVSVDYTAGTVVVVLGGAKGFQTPASFPAVAHPLSIAVGDFNNDGNPDLLVAGDTTAIMLGIGNGGFQAPVAIYDAPANYGAVGDFNGDGNPDIALSGPGHLLVALGNGNGGFKPFVVSPMHEPWAIYPGSFHNNGRQDLILVQRKAPVCLLTSNGDGTFQQGPAIFDATWGITVADMNQDGNQDLITIDGPPSSPVQVWLGDGHGNFTLTASQPVDMSADYVAVADVNGDGIPDVVTATEGNSVSIFVGTGGGNLQTGYSYKANATPLWVGIGTFFASDRADVVVLNSGGNHISGLTLSVLRDTGAGDYTGLRNVALDDFGAFALGDMNQDRFPDLIVTNSSYNRDVQPEVSILPGLGDGRFGPPVVSISLSSYAITPVVADFNGDGTSDFAVSLVSPTSSVIDVGLQRPGNQFQMVGTSLPVPVSIAWAGDLNGDGLPDLVLVNVDCFDSSSCGTVYTLLNTGHGAFGNPLQVTTSHGANAPSFVAVADFDNDGIPDLAIGAVEGCGSEYGPAVLLGHGDGTFASPICLGSSYAYAIAAGDFNGDGDQDVAFVGGQPLLQVFLGNGKGGFHALPSQATQGLPVQLFALDLNGDGNVDLASIGGAGYGSMVQVYLGTGTGGFAFEPITYYAAGYYDGGYNGGSAEFGYALPADLNNDRKIDFVSFTAGLVSVLLNTSK